MKRNIRYKPGKGQGIFTGIISCAMGLFGLFVIPNERPFIAFKALWCLMTFGSAVMSFRAISGKSGGYGHYEITEEPDEMQSSAEARLLELRGLYDKGLITDEEYEKKRKDILERL